MLIPSRAARPFLARCTTTAMASSPKATASMSLRPWNQTLINNTHHHYGNTLLIKREIGMNIWGRSKRRSNTASRARGKRRNKRVRAGENPLLVGVSRAVVDTECLDGGNSSVIGGCVLGLVTGSGWVGTYRAVTNAVLKRNGKL
eukprot:scaffold5857_cov274-Alexandrium_tamarense.AAC.3